MKKYLFLAYNFAIEAGRKVFTVISGDTECIVCGDSTSVLPLCRECRKKFFSVASIDSGLCKICGKQLISENEICMECREEALLNSVDGAFPLFSYRLWNASLLRRWKLEGERVFSGFLAGLLDERLAQLKKKFGDFAVVPVPPRPGKIRREGWDQIEELCTFLEYRYGWNVMRLLVRNTNVEQKTLDRRQRMKMIGKAYSLNAKKASSVPETVCIVDDVLTTGSTAEACAQELKKYGCRRVLVISLFCVDR